MSAALPASWLERVAQSLIDHEDRRDSLQNFPPRYEVLDEISRGGMGIVYRAWDPQLGRNVALKVLRPEDGHGAEAHERFQREARMAAGLHHPHIVPVHDTGTWNGQDYIAMQLIEGKTLEQAKPDRRTALACIRDAARALQYAHEQGIVHRDIKPSNLMLDQKGRVYITDFGIARQSVSTAGMTSPGTVVGTPAYMSPEQASGLPADARSDVYSLGATLYELVTGKAPYSGEPLDVVEAVRTRDPETARRLVLGLSKNVEAILVGAMERRPQDRYQSATELADDIDRYLNGERPTRRPRGISYKVQRAFVRHPWRSAVNILFALLLVMAGMVLAYVIHAWIYLKKAKRLPDTDPLKSQYLKIAAKVFQEAEDELTTLPKLASTAKPPENPVPLKPPPEPTPPNLSPEPPTPSAEAAARLELIASARKSARDNIDAGKLDAARQDIEVLEKVAPERAAELGVSLRKAEFELGLRDLTESVLKSDGGPFDWLYANLQSDAFRDRKDRSKLLAPILLRRGGVLAEAKRPSEAIRAFDEAERLGIQDAALFEQRGLVLLEQEQWDRAEKDLNSLRARSVGRTVYPKPFAKLFYRKEHQALSTKDWTEALKQAEIALHFDATSAAVYHDRGLARFGASGQAREALEQDLKTGLSLDSKLVVGEEYRGILLRYCRAQSEAYWGLEDAKLRDAAWQEVAAWLNLALDNFYKEDTDLLLERAVVRRRMGDLNQALQDAREALRIRNDGASNLAMGILTFLRGRLPKPDDARTREAIGFLSEAARLAPGDYRPLYWRGLSRADLGGDDLDAGIKDLQEAFRLHSSSPFLALQLAGSCLQIMFRDTNTEHWIDAADEAARAVVEADSLSEEDLVAGFYELQHLSKSQAVHLLTRDAHLCRAQAFHHGFKFDRSIEESGAAIQLDPQFRRAYIWRGYAQCTARNHTAAREDFRMAIKLSLTAEEKTKAEEWLHRCLKHSN